MNCKQTLIIYRKKLASTLLNGTYIMSERNIEPSYVVITGGGTGIGHSLTILLAQHGHKVLIIGRHI